MRTIRKHVFETNSSSCHSITFESAEVRTKYPNRLYMRAEGCYSSGGTLYRPEDKADYFAVCLAGWLKYMLLQKKKEYYNNLLDNPAVSEVIKEIFNITDKQSMYIYGLPTPNKFKDEIEDLFNSRKAEISEVFKTHGVEVIWDESEDSYHKEPHIYIERNPLSSNYDAVVVCEGAIDHESSAEFGSSDAIKLATLSPEELFVFIYGVDSCVELNFCG